MTTACPFTLCICTYKRTALLELLLDDVFGQSTQPVSVVIVDGDPGSGEVRSMLQGRSSAWGWDVVYIPSNHANLAYQRYLGWRAARQKQTDWLLYLDDDLRLASPDALESLFMPIRSLGGRVVGVTALTTGGKQAINPQRDPLLVRWFGAAKHTMQGGLTPTGNRIWHSQETSTNDSERVYWLQGRVMLFATAALDDACFSRDLFALTHIHCGLGEDTILALRVLPKGEFQCVLNGSFLHPDADSPKSYPIEAYSFAYAFAYSRRMLNDHYRYPHPPMLRDRWALLVAYLGNGLLAVWRIIRSPRAESRAYAAGYLSGAWRGLYQKPTASRLTPRIDWDADAGIALSESESIPERMPATP